MTSTLTNHHCSAFRLARQHLLPERPASVLTICRDVCGMQAQVMSAAEMAWWVRNHTLRREDIQTALWQNRTLIKTYALRGTLHILTTEDFPIYLSALQRSHVERTRKFMMRFGLSVKEIDKLSAVTMALLQAGPLSQGELTEQIKLRLGKKVREATAVFWNIFRPSFCEGLICYGPPRGQEVTFIRLDQWLPPQKEWPELEARQILLRRYLRAYGPATPQDFSRWTGIAMSEVKAVFASLMDELVEVQSTNANGFVLREDVVHLHNYKLARPTLRLLPSFDPYLLGHADKSLLVDSQNYKRVYRSQGWLSHVVLLNGKAIGVWTYTRRSKFWSLAIEPFKKFSKTLRAQILAEAASLQNFLGNSWEAPRFVD